MGRNFARINVALIEAKKTLIVLKTKISSAINIKSHKKV